MKILLYSPDSNTIEENQFFSQMESASDMGADLIVFPEKLHTPYDELLYGVDILNDEEVDYILESLFDFSVVSKMAAMFCAKDDFGLNYSIYANGEPFDGETYSKIYLKHSCKEGSAMQAEGYDEFSSALFEPIVLSGQKIGILPGDDILDENLILNYSKNGVNLIVNAIDKDNALKKDEINKICQRENKIILSCGYDGNAFVFSPTRGLIRGECAHENLYIFEINNKDLK